MIKPFSKTPYENFSKFAIDVLEQVEQHVPLTEIKSKNRSSKDIDEFLYQCAQSGYLICLSFYKDANLRSHFEFIDGLTIEGYKFLNDMYADSARKAAKKATLLSVISLLIAVLTLFCEFMGAFKLPIC